MYRSLAWICLDGARAFHLGGGCGCLLVAGGTIGVRFKIRKGSIDLKAFGGMGEPWFFRHLGQPSNQGLSYGGLAKSRGCNEAEWWMD
jgi:hypothetical protein